MTAPDLSYRKWRKLRRLVLARDPLCVYCGAPATTVDHVLPSKHGGLSSIDNLVGACARCNYSKGARSRPQGHTGGLRSSRARRSLLMRREDTSGPKDAISLPDTPPGMSSWRLPPKKGKG